MGFLRKLLGNRDKIEDSSNKGQDQQPKQPSSKKLSENVEYLLNEFKRTDDLKIRAMNNGQAVLMYFEPLVDQEKIQQNIFTPLEMGHVEHISEIPNARSSENLEEMIPTLLRGHAIYMENGCSTITRFNVTSVFNRNVEEPQNEKIVRGSHDGFIENLMINLNLVRKKVEHRDLVVKYFKVGKKTNTNIAIVYMDGIADPEIIQKMEKRIKSISVDMIQSPGYLEEFIEDNPYSPFPQMLNTERPDRVVANIMEGRIALMAEGSPTALIAPSTFFMFYQASDDYNARWYTGTFVRLVRLASFIIAIGMPAFYIAIISFHYEVLPDELLLPVKSSINEIAYPPLLEALIMVVIIELIRESGIRLPSPVGQTIGIVGGLVIGDAVVRAGLVSNLMVIVVALTAIASYVVPSNELSTTLRLMTFPLIFLAGTFGFVGIVFGFLFLTIHLTRLESFGVPYFAPVAPLNISDLKDTFVRLPLFMMKKRPKDAHPLQEKAMGESREWVQHEQDNTEN
ncbi:spore germination protein [Halobacillus halophilus]|uniref:Spore germination protein n=1 Tax=Halobacillus halophilus (strain ATCC 35676 / DSM 2266 / JCM 20832 / KCTC 3685 / LMG 17431 / NBRC 102448 / NCIMB 2269) TaxID=866895 RepID=I0JJZ4_HALH3|nr:spore germination protein [Halobacillus halophilus]ASF38613.1 spore germination protein [Halobacillus halophilus]CCG44463.1 spore germination protein [Halobacillus halophilus DSM 2266]